jgi:ribose transport system permease protein
MNDSEFNTAGAKERIEVKEKKIQIPPQIYRLIVMVVLVAAAAIFVPRFASYSNILNLVRQIFLLAMLGYGMALSMLIGGLDLSIGSVAALSTVFAGSLISQGHVIPGVLTGLVIGVGIGLLNGVMIGLVKLPDFIMTFSMMYIARGFALTYTQGQSFFNYPKSFTWIGKSFIGPVPVTAIISLVILLILYFLLYRTTFGRALYAVGSSKQAARYTGLSVSRKVIQVYALSGLIAAIAGLVYIARLNSADADLGQLWPLEAIAVCVIGGVTFVGGEGNIAGLLVGAVVVAIISNCINLLGIPPRFQDFFTGFVIILAVAVDHYTKKR